MVSTWTEYLCLTVDTNGGGKLEVCQYESLAEVQYDEEGELLDVPETIDGALVVGVDHGTIVGGELQVWSEEDIFQFTAQSLDDALAWVDERGFSSIPSLRHQLREALGGSVADNNKPELPQAVRDRIQTILSCPSLYPVGLTGVTNRRLRYERAREELEAYFWKHGLLPTHNIEVDGDRFDFG
jgi:hypothetical protein